jgi:uncharacterized membrane protein YgcG
MGRLFKGVLSGLTFAVIGIYVLGVFLIDAHYSGRINALEREQTAIDLRSAELQRRAAELEGSRMRLSVQLALAQENQRLAAAQDKPRPLALGKAPTVDVSLAETPAIKAPEPKTNTALSDMLKKLATAKSSSSGSSSGGSSSGASGGSAGGGSGGGSPPPVTRAS